MIYTTFLFFTISFKSLFSNTLKFNKINYFQLNFQINSDSLPIFSA